MTDRGEKRIVRAHFPAHHPMAPLRGKVRLIEVTVLDVKPYGFPPVVEEDLYVGEHSGAWHDGAGLTDVQQASIAEVANGR